ncbi:MAG: hypothetical protein IJN44_11625 [Clostridia bacterium]|nr:hypothetical protein [Clostridia bacterium]
MEILKIVATLQEPSFEMVSYKMGAPYAEAINEAVSLLVAQGERIADLEDKLDKLNATGLTPEDIAFFQSPKMVDICKRIRAAAERGAL